MHWAANLQLGAVAYTGGRETKDRGTLGTVDNRPTPITSTFKTGGGFAVSAKMPPLSSAPTVGRRGLASYQPQISGQDQSVGTLSASQITVTWNKI
ncbi:hypothetical protein DAPPUDRAFT_241932 [Daphnia pulex]|uniref:Uncharacterized protein n=1 Tax=Daphnia pulex TaxID=6669 RepID=E9GFF0_DAPPU|nr:hypothetical protein DAPPUDRAFT_241932 [Daphnia pulex]|eukprot:EFX81630.1 hypothetical protein DAPPUDRAFT_241932 [Daphnia pulex]